MEKKVKKITVDGLIILAIKELLVRAALGRDWYIAIFILTAFFTRYGLQPFRGLSRRPLQYWSGFT